MGGESQTPRIALTGVTRRYGEVTAVRDVDLDVDAGEFHCLAGPNGSGKTTLAGVLVGLVEPTSGTVDRPGGHVGCSFQEPSAYGDLTVAENLEVFADLGDADEEWRERLAAGLGLDTVTDRVVADLSGGYRKRLDVALALVRRPGVVVLDEPLDNLDGDSRDRVRDVLDDYRTDDRTVVVASHDLDAFEGIADRLTVLVDGEVKFDGRLDGPDATLADRYRDAIE